MSPKDDSPITELLHAAAAGDAEAFEEVSSRTYRELEKLAGSKLRSQYGSGFAGATLEPGALVNETFLKLLKNPHEFANRRHFFAFANRVMSRVLLDYERQKRAAKRGGEALRVTLSGVSGTEGLPASDVLEALSTLDELDHRKAEVVRLRILWGLSNREIAEALDISLATVERDWRFARSWIRSNLEGESGA